MWPFLQTTKNNCGCSTKTTYNQCGCNMLSSNSISYNGPELVCADVQLCDTLTDVLQKIDAKICTAGNVSGTGINNYVARWTPDGNTLGTGLIQDDNNTVSIGEEPNAFSKLNITSNKANGVTISQLVGGKGADIRSIIPGTLPNWGFVSWAGNSTTQNLGGEIVVTGGNTSTNIGITTQVTGGANNYSVQLQDGTEGINKVLTSVTSNGKANWSKVTSDLTTGASGTFTSQDGKTITVTNGLITSIV
jgi:hypothetical protein